MTKHSTKNEARPIPPELREMADRMGQAEFEARMLLEQRLREQRGKGQAKGLLGLETQFDVYAFIRFCLKISGCWRRTVRNYFDIRVVHNEVVLDRLPQAFDGFRLLHLSDLHADMHPDFPVAVRRAIASVEYDLVAVTGDFRTCTFGDHTGATEASIEILKDLPAPCFATLGNHDFLIKVPILEAAGIRFLINEKTTLQRGDSVLHIVGVDDPNFYKTHNIERALSGAGADECKVLLSHSPQTFREAAAFGVDFQISGHTHGGQICLPWGRVVMHDHSSPRHLLSGAWRNGRLQGYTSRGTGASGLPARLNCPAEVTLHTLRCGRGSS